MTCREKLKMQFPNEVHSGCIGGCEGCPHDHGYAVRPDWCMLDNKICARCWNREVEKGPSESMTEVGVALHKVIFNSPATIILWTDGTKTVVKAENEPFDPEKGMAMAIAKKFLGNNHAYYNQFKRGLPKKK